MRVLTMAMGLLLSATGCGSPGVVPHRPAPRERSSVLTTAELSSFQNAGQAIRVLRPQWLESGMPRNRASVFIDGILTPGLEVLVSIPTYQIREIRYLRSLEASTRFGNEHRGGAVMVTTRRAGL